MQQTTARPSSHIVPSINLKQADRAYLDFVASLRGIAVGPLSAATGRLYEARVAERQANGEQAPETIADVDALVGKSQLHRFRSKLQFEAQQMKHRRSHEAGEAQRERLTALLDAPIPDALGSLELDPDLTLPDYYTSVLFHTSPSSFFRTPVAGVVYDMGFANYRLGTNNANESESALIQAIPEGEYHDVLELASGTGGATVPLKRRFANANVHAIDLAAPMLKQAHHVLEQAGLAVHLKQRAAEATGYPDASFDLIFALILFHEVPAEVARQILREARRILRPGGLMVVADVEPYSTLAPFPRFVTDWQVENNGEPYWRDYGEADYPAVMKACGFDEAWQVGIPNHNFKGRFHFLSFGRVSAE